METLPLLPFIIISIQVIVAIGLFVGIIYFAFKRLEAKKREDFEKRDN